VLEESDLRTARGENPTRRSWSHPMPWKGGRWGLPEIVDYDFAAVMACLGHVARQRDTWLRNFYQVGRRAVSYDGNPYAYIVPQEQRDPVAAAELLKIMDTADVEIHESAEPFVADGKDYPAGTRAILMNQPYAAFAKTMMEVQRYPDLRQYPGGPPRTPYDTAAHNLPLQMGVRAIEVKAPFTARMERVAAPAPPPGEVRRCEGRAVAYLLRPDSNASARAVNRLLAAGAEVAWAREPLCVGKDYYPQGTFIVEAGAGVDDLLASIAREESLTFHAAEMLPDIAHYGLRAPRVGLYKSYIPNTEEGWTRFVFEEYRFPYTSLVNEDVQDGGLAARFGAIVLPHQIVRHIHHGHNPSYYPPEFAHGLGDRGARQLREFVEQGGTLVAWDAAAQYAIHYLDLPVRNALMGLTHSDFFAPGSLLRIFLDANHPIAYGMPDQAAAMFMNGPAFEPREGRIVARYPFENPLLGGLLIGHERLFGKAALVTVPVGRGEVVLIGFRVNFRAQSRGTYKLLFNSLFYSAVTGHPG
ncbi:MAG: hypothetical protein L0177_13035, partial [Chloroflexi bacterium]|nr:hypothetical protein [Chloroflexota bacterium]